MKTKILIATFIIGFFSFLVIYNSVTEVSVSNTDNNSAQYEDYERYEKFAADYITKTYYFNELGLLGITSNGDIIYEMSAAKRSLAAIHDVYPIEYKRQIDDKLLYVVYKLESEEKQPYYMYLFFEKQNSQQEKDQGDDWWLTERALFAAKSLSIKDFEHITTGSSLAEVSSIDPLTALYEPKEAAPYTVQKYDSNLNQYVEDTAFDKPANTFKAYYLLTDGLLCIQYKRASKEETFTASQLEFIHADGQAKTQLAKLASSIHPEDFPT